MSDRGILFLHILSAMLVFGATLVDALLFAAMKRTRSTAEISLLLRLALRVPVFAVPGVLIALMTGIMLVIAQGYNFGAPWLSAAFTLWFVVVALALMVLTPGERDAYELAQRELAAGHTESDALVAAVTSPRLQVVTKVIQGAVLVLVILMVFKPGM